MVAKSNHTDLAKEIDALRRMTVNELRRGHVELLGGGFRPWRTAT